MPYFRDLLTADEIREVVGYIKTLSPAFAGAAPQPVRIPARVPADAVSLARGRALYADLGCDSCHGADGRRREKQRDAKHYPVITRDLTAPWTFVGGSDPEQLWLRLTTLSSLSPMPSYAESATPTERWHVVNYVLSLARTPAWQPGGRLDGPGQHVDPMTRGGIPRSRGDVRALPHVDQSHRHLSRRRLLPGRGHARGCLPARCLREPQSHGR